MSIFKINELREEEENLKTSIKQLESRIIEKQNEIKDLEGKAQQKILEINNLDNQKKELTNQIQNREDFIIKTELKYMDNIPGLEFEHFCKDVLEKNGFIANVTKSTGDSGGDIIATKDNVTYVIQCKKYSDKVGNKAVQEVYTAQGIYKTQKAIVMTNNFFTEQAINEASILGVQLWDRNIVTNLIQIAYEFAIKNIDYIPKTSELYGYSDTDLYSMDDLETDPLLEEAMEFVIETGQASTSFIQRKFKIGYARAGRIIDQLEERGIISGYQGSKPRQVLMTTERFMEIKNSIK